MAINGGEQALAEYELLIQRLAQLHQLNETHMKGIEFVKLQAALIEQNATNLRAAAAALSRDLQAWATAQGPDALTLMQPHINNLRAQYGADDTPESSERLH